MSAAGHGGTPEGGREWKCPKTGLWSWLDDYINLLKIIKLCSYNGWALWYINYNSIRLFKKKKMNAVKWMGISRVTAWTWLLSYLPLSFFQPRDVHAQQQLGEWPGQKQLPPSPSPCPELSSHTDAGIAVPLMVSQSQGKRRFMISNNHQPWM